MARILIGSYIIDSADASSTSTTSGVVLDLDDAQPLQVAIDREEFRWPIMYAHITAATEAALNTAIEAVRAKIEAPGGFDVIYEETASTTLIKMDADEWPQADGAMEVEISGLTADIAFSFTGRRSGPVASGAGDEAGQTSPINWQYETAAGGIGLMVVRATFGPTISGGSITAGSRQNAVAFINKLRNTANYPSWLATTFRMLNAVVEFEQKENQASVGESSYDPCVATITFNEMDSAVTWPSNVQSGNYTVSPVEREPLDVRAGELGGKDFVLRGTLTLKTEGNTTFNSSDSAIAAAAVYSTAVTTVANILTYITGTLYSSFALTQLGGADIDIERGTGVVNFSVRLVSSTVLSWTERGRIRNVDQKVWSRATDGTDWEYERNGGPLKVFTHALEVLKVGAGQPYKPPNLGNDWSRIDEDNDPVYESKYSNGQLVSYTLGASTWRWVNATPRGREDKRTQARGLIRLDFIGDGEL